MEMRNTSSAFFMLLLLVLFPVLAVSVRAGGDINEADYPAQYEVMDSSRAAKLVVAKSCSMTLRDKAKPDTQINVSRKGYGSCQLLATGQEYRGRENDKKNQIELVVPVGDSKARVENWQITGTVDAAPRSDRPTS
jgi:hypothetical protein